MLSRFSFFGIFILMVVNMIPVSCKPAKENPMKKLEWLAGHWEKTGEDIQYYELWQKVNDTLYSGIGYVMQNGDTVFYENIKIEQRADGIYYIPAVSGQNNNEAVLFKLTSDSAGMFIFENKTHDFPQRIGYSNPQQDALYAYVDGNEEGKYRKEEFQMTRKK